MKKIFTLLFFAGLVTSALAQNGRNAQYRNGNSNSQSPVYATNGQGGDHTNGAYNQPYPSNNGSSVGNDYGHSNGYHQNDQAYHHNESGYDRQRFDERNDDRRFRGNDRFDRNPYAYERQKEFERSHRARFNARVAIRFGQASCY